MITRYSRPDMRAIWTDENKLRIWLQIELLASEALVREGVVPRADFLRIKAGCDRWFKDLPGLVARQKLLLTSPFLQIPKSPNPKSPIPNRSTPHIFPP